MRFFPSPCLLPFALVMTLALACGDDDKENNTKVTPTNAATGSTGSTGSTDSPPLTYQTRYETRFTKMTILDGDKIPAYNPLNSIIKQNIKPGVTDPIVILAAFRDIDPAAGTLKLKAGSGVEDVSAGEHKWDPDTPDVYTDGTIEKDTGFFSGKIDSFAFIASLVGGEEKTSLRIRNLEFSGKLTRTDNDVQVNIVEGLMSGHITKQDADQTMFILFPGGEPQALTSLFEEKNLNLDTDNDGTMDAWSLRANYEAEATVINR